MELTLIRNAKEQVSEVTPAERPQQSQQDDDQLAAARTEFSKLGVVCHGDTKKGAGDQEEGEEFVVVMPGLLLPGKRKEFPEDLEIRITKKGKEKAEIHVKMGGEEWNVDEASLDELPEEVRGYVKQFLNREAAVPMPGQWENFASIPVSSIFRSFPASSGRVETLVQGGTWRPV